MVANDKLQGFVGEPTAPLHMSSQFNAAITPLLLHFSPLLLLLFLSKALVEASTYLAFLFLRSQTDSSSSPLLAVTPRQSGDEIFKTFAMPALAMLP